MDFGIERGLQEYETIRHNKLVISDKTISMNKNSFLTVDIRLARNSNIPKQDEKFLETKIYVEYPNNKFNIMVKKHKSYPISGSLKTEGFISPSTSEYTLSVVVQNPNNYEIR